MPLPFYDRITSVCPGCKRRQHLDNFRKWKDANFGMAALCLTCEPSVKPESPDPVALRRERDFLAEKAERFVKPVKLVPMATCPGCDTLLKLQLFRKWWGGKRMKRTLCINCEPERRLEHMTPTERAAFIDVGRARVTPQRVERLNQADAQAQRQRRSTAATRRHSAARTRAWAPTLSVLRKERTWCYKNMMTSATVSPQWHEFFEAYAQTLSDALLRAAQKKANTSSVSDVPAPHTFLYKETLLALRRLYAQCPVLRGRRLYRDPLCLAWWELV